MWTVYLLQRKIMEIIDIQSFMSNFSEHVIYSYIKVPSVSLAHGIHFLYPAPDQSNGAVFLGTYSEWIDLNPDKDFREGCTYIIVTDNESVPEAQPWLGRNINMVLVCSNIADTLHGIRAFFESFQNHTSKDGQQELIHFFQEISNPKEDSIKVFQHYCDRFPYPLRTFIAVIVLKPGRSFHSSIQEVTKRLSLLFPETNLFYYEKEWILFYSQEEQASGHVNISYQDFSDFLTSFHLYAGISYVGVRPENLYTLYLTAQASLNLGVRISLPSEYRRIFFFSQYHALYIIHLCAAQYDRRHNRADMYYLAHPDIVRIYLYDKDHNSDLLDTLYAFLINDSNLTKAAQHLYMHRNTVYNKLLKIESIIGYRLDNVDNTTSFILSYMVVRYYRDYLKNDIS